MQNYKKGLVWLKEHKIAKYTAIALMVGVVSFTGYKVIPMNDMNKDLSTMATDAGTPLVYDYYQVTMAGNVLGNVPDQASAQALYDAAYEVLKTRIGYDPEISLEMTMALMSSETYNATAEDVLVDSMATALYDSIDELKVKAYVMKIGEEFVVSVESEEALKEVLKGAESIYLNDASGIKVELKQDPNNSLVLKPEVTVLAKELSEERLFVTGEMMLAQNEAAQGSLLDESTGEITGDGSGNPMEDLFAGDKEFVESVVKEITLDQSIVIVESYVSKEEIKTIEEAIELITKEHEKEKMYEVKTGDCPSIIAVENGMATRDLYSMNPGLEENASKMQIGDEIVIMVPEPELFVTTVEDVIYTEYIDRSYTYVNNPDAYIGTDSVLEPGYDGVIEVRATIWKVNGKEKDRVINEETTLLQPKSEKVFRGIKALPVTTATGVFDMPLINYTFTSGFGSRWGRLHSGIDLAAPTGTNVLASDGGRVIKSGWNGALGYMIEIDHGNGMTSVYGHNSKLYVSVGDEVAKYETIAAVGSTGNSTGPHVHFEIRVNGTAKNPLNYLK